MTDIRSEQWLTSTSWTGNVWARTHKIEALVNGLVEVPQQLVIPPGKLDPSNVFLNMGHAATIIAVHRVASFQAGKSPLTNEIMQRSQAQCYEAAATIFNMMKLTSHWEVHIVRTPSLQRLSAGSLI